MLGVANEKGVMVREVHGLEDLFTIILADPTARSVCRLKFLSILQLRYSQVWASRLLLVYVIKCQRTMIPRQR